MLEPTSAREGAARNRADFILLFLKPLFSAGEPFCGLPSSPRTTVPFASAWFHKERPHAALVEGQHLVRPELLLILRDASALLSSVITCHVLCPPQQHSLWFLKGKIRNSGQMDIWEDCW